MPPPPDVSVIVATYKQPFTTGLALNALFLFTPEWERLKGGI